MSTIRLTFLYPHLFRASRYCEWLTAGPAIFRIPHPRCPSQVKGGARGSGSRCFTTARRRQDQFVKRHGKAVEPLLVKEESGEGVKGNTSEEKEGKKDGKPAQIAFEPDGAAAIKPKGKQSTEPSSPAPLSETQAATRLPGDAGHPATSARGKGGQEGKSKDGPKDTVLRMPPAETAEEENDSKPPHLQTPPYVHHFDTYTLVQQVEAGGFTAAQSVTAMKAVRGLLAQNLDVARRGLVSKSDVENETYLFRAAVSELKTEIQNTRKKDEETMRRERTLLQHEVDILNQKLTQELLTLKDDLKGMFDDRKMSVRSEQRAMESKIQELNYKITVLLNSDSKSEIEGLRWVLTRRSVMGILFMAFMVLTSLRYASYKSHEDEFRMKKKGDEVARPEAGSGLDGGVQTQVGAAEILAAN